MDHREKSGCLKFTRILFIVCHVITLVLSFIFILLFIINPTLMVYDDEGRDTKLTDGQAREALLQRTVLVSITVPLSLFAVFAIYKDHVKFLWFSFAFDIVLMIGMFIFGIHWIELVLSLVGVAVFGCYVHNLSKFQKSLRFDRNLGLSKI